MSHSETPESSAPPAGSGNAALLVGAGIFLSRIAGLIRDRVFAHFFGNSDAADAFKAAFRIPNFLQNLFGEGTLSASFIPVYARLLAEGNEEESRRVASGVGACLGLVVSVLVALGVAAAPHLIAGIAPGFSGEKKELTIRLVRILFPGAGLLVCSAWCLGILNSHRRFFLSYAAPVLWNAVLIVTLLVFGVRQGEFRLAETLAWASVLGSAAQFCVQLPLMLKLVKTLPVGLHWALSGVRTVIRNFLPVFFGRGVTQISAYVDELLASLLPTGAFAALSYAQTLYMLPVSLFGMSVSASELPAMSSALGDEKQIAGHLKQRLNRGLRRIAFFIVPSAMAFLALGDVIAAAIYQTGRFSRPDAVYVWGVLAGASVGLLATTLGRLYSSTYYALRDTRTPLRYAVVRVSITALLGYFFALVLPDWIGVPVRWGVAGLTLSAGIGGWVEFSLLRRTLNRRIGRTGLPPAFLLTLWLSAAVSAALGFGIKQLLGQTHPVLVGLLVLGPYGSAYFALTALWRVPESTALFQRIMRRARH
jgi:putative peptidoglycan lipid II flippase